MIARPRRRASAATPRMVISKSLPFRWPAFRLFVWRLTSRTVNPLPSTLDSRDSARAGTETHCRVTARRSFMPAVATSRRGSASARPMKSSIRSCGTSCFSTNRYRWSPRPLGAYAGRSVTTKSSGRCLIRPPMPGSSGVSMTTSGGVAVRPARGSDVRVRRPPVFGEPASSGRPLTSLMNRSYAGAPCVRLKEVARTSRAPLRSPGQ